MTMSYTIKHITVPGSAFKGSEFNVHGPWTDELTKVYNEAKHTSLLLHPYRDGWRITDSGLSFLDGLWRIKSLRVFGASLEELAPVLRHPEIERLSLDRIKLSSPKVSFDFAKLPCLKVLDVHGWHKGMHNVETLTDLESLEIWGLLGVNALDLSGMKMLRRFSLHGARTLQQVKFRGLRHLNWLELLAAPKLSKVEGIEDIEVTEQTFVRIDGAKRVPVHLLKHFANAGHCSFQGKQIVSQGKNVRPWPEETT